MRTPRRRPPRARRSGHSPASPGRSPHSRARSSSHPLYALGRNTLIGGEVILADFTPAGRNARVPDPRTGHLEDAGATLLGCAVGHRARLMAGLYVAPGRAIPNDLTVIGPQADVLRRLPPGEALAAAPADAVWAPDGRGSLAPLLER